MTTLQKILRCVCLWLVISGLTVALFIGLAITIDALAHIAKLLLP